MWLIPAIVLVIFVMHPHRTLDAIKDGYDPRTAHRPPPPPVCVMVPGGGTLESNPDMAVPCPVGDSSVPHIPVTGLGR
jgi:hypothetical protein